MADSSVETETALPMTVAGAALPTGQTFEVINPATGKAFATAPHATAADVDAAVAAAKAAFPAWASTPIAARQAVMMQAHAALSAHAGELAELLVKEQGKPLAMAEGEIALSLDNIKFHGGEFSLPVKDLGSNETHKTVVLHKPIGVVAGITPWNFPIFCAVQNGEKEIRGSGAHLNPLGLF